MNKNYSGIIASAALGLTLGCSVPETTNDSAGLEQRLTLPSEAERERLLQTTCMVRNNAVYDFVEQAMTPEGTWAPNGKKGQMTLVSYGSGVGLAHEQNSTYVLTAKHVVDPREEHMTLQHMTLPLRRVLVRSHEELGMVTRYWYDAGELQFDVLPLEVVATSQYDLALVRTQERAQLNTVSRLGQVHDGDIIYGVGYKILQPTASEYLNLGTRVIRAFDVGFVKSVGDPNESTDDHINYITLNTQHGNSGGPVFNQECELVGLRAHAFILPLSSIEDMVNSSAIGEFLVSSGYGRFISPAPRAE